MNSSIIFSAVDVELIHPKVPKKSGSDPAELVENRQLVSRVDFNSPRQMRVCFPVLLDGDLVNNPEHLGVGYLVSILRNLGILCIVIDLPAGSSRDQYYIDKIVSFEPDIIGLSLTNVSVVHATEFGSALKKKLPHGVQFLAGGPLATALGSKLLNNPNWRFLDALVRGEGDVPIVRYVEAFWENGDYSKVPGLSWRTLHGELIDNSIGYGVQDLDNLPEPARDQFMISSGQIPYLRVATTRGCTSSCTFCNAPHSGNKVNQGKVWRSRSSTRVLDEIERLHFEFRADSFEFVDSTFEDPGGGYLGKKRIKEIAEGILDRGLSIFYSCCMRANNWGDQDVPLLELLYRSGLEKVIVGIESGSQSGLDIWGKKTTVEENVRAIRLLRGAGIYVVFGFIAFHPWSTFEEIRENNTFLHVHFGHHLSRYIAPLELYPGAKIINSLRDGNLLHDTFDITLNPFAYDYFDKRIGLLARLCFILTHARERVSNSSKSYPLLFEDYDMAFSIRLKRLRRQAIDEPKLKAILAVSEQALESIHKQLSDFNYILISRLTDAAESLRLTDLLIDRETLASNIFYEKKYEEIQQIEMQLKKQLILANYRLAYTI